MISPGDPIGLRIADLTGDDVDRLAAAFAEWPKPRELFAEYAERAAAGDIDFLGAVSEDGVIGYLTIAWRSTYPGFIARGIPELVDLNVLSEWRGGGAATALMDEAERRVGPLSEAVGVRVGLAGEYGGAQRLYVERGYVPDGMGVTIDGRTVPADATIPLESSPVLALQKDLSST